MTIFSKNQSAGKRLNILLQKPFYLFFFACYPIVLMFSNNKTDIQGWMIIRPLIVSLTLDGNCLPPRSIRISILIKRGIFYSRLPGSVLLVRADLSFPGKRAILDRANHSASLSTPAGVDDSDRYLLARYKKGYIRSYHPIEHNHLGSVGYPNG